jgi:hypothetical protein
VLSCLDPALTALRISLLSELQECRPVNGMVIFKLHITMKLIPELLRRNMLTHVIIILKLLSCQGINERRDEF